MAIPVISIAQMREWELASWAAGKTEAQVIRRVGNRVADYAMRMTRASDQVLILAGKGHNGDDARCARECLASRRVEVFNVINPAGDLPKLEHLLAQRPALVVDGLFGIGVNRPLSAEWVEFIARINKAGAPVLAVDVPSGLNADTGEPQGAAVRATVTLTVGAPKIGMLQEPAWSFVGRLEVADDVGLVPCPLTSDVNWTCPQDFVGFPPPRPAPTHKGSYGHLAIVAGSPGYHGAAVLAARGAQRAQPGLITVHTLQSVYAPIASQLQAVMVSPWRPEAKLSGPWSAILLGPGLKAAEPVGKLKLLLRHLWQGSPLSVVVDASALDWLPAGKAPKDALRVITPHPGEAARLMRCTVQEVQANRLDALRTLSKRFGNAWVVLKGHQTLIGQSTGEVHVNPSGNPHLAQGGSGDVLGGYIAGLLAQPTLHANPLTAIRYAVWQHGAAADRLQATCPNWVVEDLIPMLGNQRGDEETDSSRS